MNTSQSLNILVVGSGGREHAIIKAVKRSSHLGKLYCSPGNGGIAADAECVPLGNHQTIVDFCTGNNIDLVIIGPEQPLVDGLSDLLRENNILVFGPSQAAAQLEASKAFTKGVCDEGNIPTAAYASFTDAVSAQAYLSAQSLPVVIKADGLAAGKGVIIAHTMAEAQQTIKEMFAGKFGEAGLKLVIEEFLDGEELSFFALCDGKKAFAFGSAQDHKAAYDGDKGPNTGGMGTYSPAPVMNPELEAKIMQQIIMPALDVMQRRGTPYQGILFAGLMIKHNQPKLIEFNARLGDPETQVILTRLQEDLLMLFYAAAKGQLPSAPLSFDSRAALCVVMAAKGYPGEYQKHTVIKGVEEASALADVVVYHAGTMLEEGELLANGGRVLGVTALGNSVSAAQAKAYEAVDQIDWKEGFCRRDIGWRAIEREKEAAA